MRALLRSILFYTVALYLVITYIPGIQLKGGVEILLGSGVVLAILVTFVRPAVKIITLPINILTLGIFSGFVNVIILFLLTRFIDQLSIQAWTFSRFEYQGFVIPETHISTFWTYVIVSSIISIITNALNWLCN